MGSLAAAVAVLATAALAWGTLCLGEDGHVAFEVSVAGRCLDDVGAVPPGEHGAHLTACEREAGCGSCTDLRGSSGAWLARVTSDLPEPPPVFLSSAFAPVAPVAADVAFFRIGDAAPGADRTATAPTVLRC